MSATHVTNPRTANRKPRQRAVAIMPGTERASERVLRSAKTRASSLSSPLLSSSSTSVCVNLLPEHQPPLIAKHTPVGKGTPETSDISIPKNKNRQSS